MDLPQCPAQSPRPAAPGAQLSTGIDQVDPSIAEHFGKEMRLWCFCGEQCASQCRILRSHHKCIALMPLREHEKRQPVANFVVHGLASNWSRWSRSGMDRMC